MELQRKKRKSKTHRIYKLPKMQRISKNKGREKMKGLTTTLEGYKQNPKIKIGQLIKSDKK